MSFLSGSQRWLRLRRSSRPLKASLWYGNACVGMFGNVNGNTCIVKQPKKIRFSSVRWSKCEREKVGYSFIRPQRRLCLTKVDEICFYCFCWKLSRTQWFPRRTRKQRQWHKFSRCNNTYRSLLLVLWPRKDSFDVIARACVRHDFLYVSYEVQALRRPTAFLWRIRLALHVLLMVIRMHIYEEMFACSGVGGKQARQQQMRHIGAEKNVFAIS